MTLEEKTLQRPDGSIHYWIGGKRRCAAGGAHSRRDH